MNDSRVLWASCLLQKCGCVFNCVYNKWTKGSMTHSLCQDCCSLIVLTHTWSWQNHSLLKERHWNRRRKTLLINLASSVLSPWILSVPNQNFTCLTCEYEGGNCSEHKPETCCYPSLHHSYGGNVIAHTSQFQPNLVEKVRRFYKRC